jgi:hypothetical protein
VQARVKYALLALVVALIVGSLVYYASSDSWCSSGKLQGPCDSWPMKDVPESLKVHLK